MSKFLSGRQSNLKLGVAGYTENKTVLETTGRVGIGTTNAESFSLYVVGPTNITGIATFKSDVFIDDQLFVGGLNITGGATLGEDITARHLNLSGIATVTGDTDLNGNLDVDGTTELDGLNVDGSTTLDATTVDGTLTVNGDIDLSNNLDVDGNTELDGLNVDGATTLDGVTVGLALTVTGNADLNGNLDVDGNTELDGLNVDGSTTLDATTVDGLLDINAGGQANTFKVEDLTDNRIVLAGSGGELEDSANLTFDGATLDVTGHTELDQLRVAGVSTFAGNVDISSNGNLTVAGNLIVQGTETRLNTTALEVEDINIGIASATPKLSNASLDGAGITIHGSQGDKTLTWSNANSRMEFNTDLYSPNFFVGGITATGDVDFDGNLDVDGHTELDQLRVSGVSTFQGNVDLGDNDRLRFGDGQDLQIYHSGTGSFITDGGTGNLRIGGSAVKIENSTNTANQAVFVSGAEVSLYHNGSKKFETTGYGATVYNDLRVGTGVTIYGNAGIVSAISFYGDGSNLTNTGATLSATSGVERLVTTQLTSGTMVDAATDADLTFDAGTNTLNTENIKISGGISTDGTDYGQQFQLLRAQGNGKWEWATVPGIFSVNNILNGFNVLEEGGTVGTAGSIHTLDFRGINVTASADPQPNGIATITFSSTPTFDSVTVNDFIDLNGDLEVLGVSTFSSNVHVGSGITMYAATGIVSATKLYGDGSDLTGINAGAILGISSGTQRLVMTGLTSGAMLNAATDVDLRYNSVTDTLITENLNVVGLSTFVGVGTFYDDLYVHGNLNVTGDIVYDEISGRNLNITGIATFGGPISVGGSTGTNGQYLKSTGVGVTWADFPTLRTTHTENANAGVTTFNFTYNVNFLDVFINGVKLTPTEYTASNGSTVTLATPTFQDDIVELVSYNTVSSYAGAGSSTGVSDGDKGDIIVTGSGTNWQIDANTIGPNELINTSVTPGTYNFATLTVDADGRLTAASSGTETPESFTAVGIQSGGTLVGAAKTLNFIGAGNTFAVNGDTIDISISGGGGGASVEVSDTAPSSPSEGDLWWRSTDGKGFIYYNDGNSNQWVEFNPSATGIAGINTTGFSYFTSIVTNSLTATGTITANSFSGITTSMISDYGNGLEAGANVAISTNPPSNPAEGDLWWDSDTGKGYIYYSDVDSNQWVEFNPAGSAGSGGGGGSLNDLVDDLTPQLGGNLDLNNKNIVGTGNIPAGNLTGALPAIDASNVTGIVTTNLGKANVTIGDNPPGSGTAHGDLWWESDTATGYIYYNDGNTSQWVQFNGGAGSGGGSSYSNSDVDTHLNTSSATSGQILSWNGSDYAWVADQTGGTGIGTSRFSVSNTTGSIGAGTTADITITGAKAYSLFKIETSHAAWVRLYTDTTSRTNDASRAYTTDPTPGSGVLAEVYTTTTGSNTFKMTPAVTGWNDDATPSTNIYAKVTNNESTSQDITVTLTILRMED